MTASHRSLLPSLALVVSVLALSISPFFVRWADAPGPVLGFYRIGLAALFLTPFALRQQRREAVPPLRQVWLFPLLGGIATALDLSLWTTALSYTSVANSTLLSNTAPLWVALFAWLVFRERLKPVFWVGLALALSGAGLVMGRDVLRHPQFGVGDLMAIGSGFFYAIYFLAAQRGRERLSAVRFVWLMNIAAAVTLLVLLQFLHMPIIGYSAQTYVVFILTAVVVQMVGYFSIVYALGHLPASIVSPTLIGQPVISALLAIPLVGEHISAYQAAGGLAVLAGLALIYRSRSQKAGRDQAPAEVEVTPAPPAPV